ncbi:MAG: phage holin family protein [Pygmaiobacter sp.]
MEQYEKWIKAALGAVAGGCTLVWGGADTWLSALMLFIVLDYCSGVSAAVIRCELSSTVGFHGLLKKVLVLLIAAVANQLDLLLGANGVLRSVVLGFYIANEGISLLENAARCGVSIPKNLLRVLKQLQSEEQFDDKK